MHRFIYIKHNIIIIKYILYSYAECDRKYDHLICHVMFPNDSLKKKKYFEERLYYIYVGCKYYLHIILYKLYTG